MAIDKEGNVYITGWTWSGDFPISSDAYDTSNNDNRQWDIFVSKLSGDLTQLLASTYLGTDAFDISTSIAIDKNENIFVAGYTYSNNFPTTPEAFDTSWNGSQSTYWNGFVSKFNSNLTQLLASTYLGGSGGDGDQVSSVAIDSDGNVYVTGSTDSVNFPTTEGALDTSRNNSRDGFISRLSGDLKTLLASTFLGSSGTDYGNAIALDAEGNIYVTGSTASADFSTTLSGYDTTYNGVEDAFVSKLNGSLTELLASTYLGGTDCEQGRSISIDRSGNIIVGGWTLSSNFPTTTGAYDTSYNGYGEYMTGDVFVSKLSSDLKNLLASTYLGGASDDSGVAVVDQIENIYVVGSTYSSDFPITLDAFQVSHGVGESNSDGFIAKLNKHLTTLLSSTYLGGDTLDDVISCIATKSTGDIYVAGQTRSSGFPVTTNAYDTSYNGYGWMIGVGAFGDAFVSKFFLPNSYCNSDYLSISKITPETGGDAGSVTMHIYGCNFQTGAVVKLIQDGQSDVVANAVSVYNDGKTIDATFDLTGKTVGIYSVVVTNPDSATITLPDAFTIEAVREPEFWAEILGRPTVMGGRPAKFYLAYGNKGNVDAPGAMIWLRIPSDITVDPGLLYNSIDDDGSTVIQIPLSNISSGTTQLIPITLTFPLVAHGLFTLQVSWATGTMTEAVDDVTASVNTEIVESTDTTLKTVMHVSNPNFIGDITLESVSVETDTYMEPIVTITEIGDEIEYRIDATLENKTKTGLQTQGYTTKAVLQVNFTGVTTIIRGGREAYENMERTREEVDRIREILDSWTVTRLQQEITNWLLERGCINEKEAEEMNRLSRGSRVLRTVLPYTPDNIPYADVISELSTLMDPGWAIRVRENCIASYGYGNCFKDFKRGDNQDCSTMQSADFAELVAQKFLIDQYKKSKSGKKTSHHETLISGDPNEKSGIQGTDERHYTSGEKPLEYTIYFENVGTATAAAQEITVTDQLGTSSVNLGTFGLGAISFGDKAITPPTGLTEYSTEVDLRPNKEMLVRIDAALDKDSGLVIWHLIAIDPTTGELPEDPQVGILPPNIKPPEGDGSVVFSIMPKGGLVTNTEVRNKAKIVFDVNAPIETNEWLNMIDNDDPSSHVQPLAARQMNLSFPVYWDGTDVGAGVRDYTVYVSVDGGAYTPWITNGTDTASLFTGAPGMRYAFYSTATDNAGNLEDAPHDADAVTRINIPPVANAGDDQQVYVNGLATLNGGGSSDTDGDALSYQWVFHARPSGSAAAFSDETSKTPTFTPDKAGTYTIGLTVNDGATDSAPDTVVITTINRPPVADAGLDQTIHAGRTATLDGSSSSDPDGDAITHLWTFASIPAGSAATLSNATAVKPTFVADKVGAYTVSLVVNDGAVNSPSDTVTINAANTAPTADAGSDQTAGVGDTVTLNGSSSADADGDPITYSWSLTSRPPGSAASLSNANTVSPTFVVDIAGAYAASLTVNDGFVNSAPDVVAVTAHAPMADGLQALYPFNEGSGTAAHDASGNGRDGVVHGATWTAGKESGGLSFNGKNHYVSIPTINNDEFSLCAWFNKGAKDTKDKDVILGGYQLKTRHVQNGGFALSFDPSAPDTLEFTLVTQNSKGKRTQKIAGAKIHGSVGSWHHVAGVYDKETGKQMLYVDGKLVSTVTHPANNIVSPLTRYTVMNIGCSLDSKGYYKGVIDDVRLYNRALSEQEIHAIIQEPLEPENRAEGK